VATAFNYSLILSFLSACAPYASAARRLDGALTTITINLSQERKTQSIRIGDKTMIQAEMWLFEPPHPTEKLGTIEIAHPITVPAQSSSIS